jgi:DNA-binding NarL/FixJ family response regulator
MHTLPLYEASALNDRLCILVIGHHPIVIDGLKLAFQSIESNAEISSAVDMEQAQMKFCGKEKFSLVLLDLELKNKNDFDLLELTIAEMVEVPVVIFSSDEEKDTVQRVLDAGAKGFISKRSQTAVLIGALHLVLAGGIYIPPQMLNRAQNERTAPTAEDRVASALDLGNFGLTDRQLDVLNLLVQGKPNKVICRELSIAEGTAKSHISAILRALKVKNRTQVSAIVGQLGAKTSDRGRHLAESNILGGIYDYYEDDAAYSKRLNHIRNSSSVTIP